MKNKKALYITGIVLFVIGLLGFSLPFIIVGLTALNGFEKFENLVGMFAGFGFGGMVLIIVGSMIMNANKVDLRKNKGIKEESSSTENYYDNRIKKVNDDKVACPICGHLNKKSDLYCDNCGSKLTKFCSNCGNVVSCDDKFCPKCGNKIE